ncbi:anthranilate synthase component I [Halapricum desulfuricans]|uniref:Anthranilate synthase component 1 n=1 Tax=Halapricum desulfuricans TaxID=2841257 RepID=A0A897N6L2_9EURY|nr:anthranilate synthase component I [Halapricum desulfuricans]QSG08204.1 Anthranilate/para-aminobenzoate synthase component I [Halapricum desulfuricans]QSG12669.1 Anthranilate/para-aminobenzoate synthase component I [Halapricum desulfuricans]
MTADRNSGDAATGEVDFDRSREAFVDLASGGRPAVVRLEANLDADVDPLSAYAALTGRTTDREVADYTFLLESAGKVASSDPDGAFAPTPDDRHARYSFVGYDPVGVVTVDAETTVEVFDDRYADFLAPNGGDVLDSLRACLPDAELRGFPEHDRQLLEGGLVGFLAYDAVYDLWLDEVGLDRPDSRFPDAQFLLTTKTLVFDHAEDTVSLVATPLFGPGHDAGERYDELRAEAGRIGGLLADATDVESGNFEQQAETAGPKDDYEDAVRQAKESVLDGDIYQGVISRKRELYGDVDPLGLYEALRSINPSPYMYLLDHDDLSVVGASPETLVSVDGDRVMVNPIAGTCPRGTSPVEDRRLAGEMLADEKERAEHTMLVDLGRNDVRRVAEPGSVRVEEFMNVLKYSHVQHIESTVTGTLADDADSGRESAARETDEFDAFDAVRATFPAGTLSGAPKIRAMEIIDDLEREPRGLYGGGVGYFSWDGNADFAIVIRSATIEADQRPPDSATPSETADRITVQAGAGIVADSVPEREYEETENKMRGVLDAIEAIRVEPEEVSP